MLQTDDPDCMETPITQTLSDIEGYNFEFRSKGRCADEIKNKTNIIFRQTKTGIDSCAKKCSNENTCSFFSISGSKICRGYKTCTEKTSSGNINKIYRKGSHNIIVSY